MFLGTTFLFLLRLRHHLALPLQGCWALGNGGVSENQEVVCGLELPQV